MDNKKTFSDKTASRYLIWYAISLSGCVLIAILGLATENIPLIVFCFGGIFLNFYGLNNLGKKIEKTNDKNEVKN